MKRSSLLCLTAILISSLLLGCQPQPAAPPPVELAQPATIARPEPIEGRPTFTPLPTPEPPATSNQPPATSHQQPATSNQPPTTTPTAVPTTVPVRLAAPSYLLDLAGTAVALMPPGWDWQFVPADDPAAALAAGEADLALVQSSRQVVAQRPLAIIVPLTTAWEEVRLETAQRILADGHNLARAADWAAIPRDHKALRVDGRHPADPDYPPQADWSLIAAPGFEAAQDGLTAVFHQSQPAEPVVHIAAVGDIMLDRGMAYMLRELGELDYPFRLTVDWLRPADLTIGNIESSLGDIGEPAQKRYTFQAPPQAAGALALAGFDVVSLANNHAMDYGSEALLQGIDLLRDAGVAPIGAGANDAEAHRPFITTVNGLRLALLAYVNVPVEASTGFDTATWTATADAPGLAWGDPARIQADVAAVRPQVDHVIVVLHSGLEYIEEPDIPQVAAAQAAIDAGATLVIGHHAHILQGIDFHGDGTIVYGLGNFAFSIEGDPATAVLNVWLDRDGVRQVELLPAIIREGGQPRPATPDEAAAIRQRVYFLTTILNAN